MNYVSLNNDNLLLLNLCRVFSYIPNKVPFNLADCFITPTLTCPDSH